MAQEKLLTIRDASLFLGISEKEVMDSVEKGELIAYKVGGVYLRFKQHNLEEFKKSFKPAKNKTHAVHKYSLKDKISDFFYFNDFYILSILAILLILFIILRR